MRNATDTDKLIRALVGDGGWSSKGMGFTLPPDLELFDPHGYWALGLELEDLPHWIEPQQAYDLCAMHFLREGAKFPVRIMSQMWRYVHAGDSAAAIKALHDALTHEHL